jgi:hypothetical protein
MLQRHSRRALEWFGQTSTGFIGFLSTDYLSLIGLDIDYILSSLSQIYFQGSGGALLVLLPSSQYTQLVYMIRNMRKTTLAATRYHRTYLHYLHYLDHSNRLPNQPSNYYQLFSHQLRGHLVFRIPKKSWLALNGGLSIENMSCSKARKEQRSQ